MPRQSQAIEHYLKAMYELEEETGTTVVGTAALADRLGVSRASVSGMLKKLGAAPHPLLTYARYRGARLTPSGRLAALEVVRHHRLIEAYLITALGYSWDEVHAEADHLEHAISEDLEERIAAYLGHPGFDPHGAVIPRKDGSLPRRPEVRLSDLTAGQAGAVSRVNDEDPEMLRYLGRIGVRPTRRLQVIERAPFEGPLHVRLDDASETVALNRAVTDGVFVEPESESEGAH